MSIFQGQLSYDPTLMMKRLQLAALALGVGFFAYLILVTGPAVLLADLRAIGWALGLVIVLELMVDAANTMGWRYTFPPHERRVSFASLFLVRLAGTAFNQVLPAATLGGEPIKAMLLRPALPLSSTLASVVTAKLTYSLAQAIFVLGGFAVAFRLLDLPAVFLRALVIALLLMLLGLAGFHWLQRRGLFAGAARVSHALGLPKHWLERVERAASSLDAHIRDFHVSRPRDFALSIAWHLTGLACGVVQVYVLLCWLDLPADPVKCFAIEAFALLVQAATFFVPGGIGVQEGGKVLIFTALGLPAKAGLSVGVAFRLNQIVGIALGLASYAFLQSRRHAATVTAETGAKLPSSKFSP